MQRRFIYFINPISGTKNKESVLATIKQKTTAQNIPFEILHTNAAGDYNYLQQKIIDEKITDVIICGGDGTVNQVANYLQKIDVNVGIVPLGSGNGLALAAKISKNTSKALDIIFAGKSDWIDAFYLNKKFSCMLCGFGFDAQVAHDFAKQSKRGLATYVKQSIKNFMVAKPYPFTIWVDDAFAHRSIFYKHCQ
jgi:diacylglycerol kinase (ATP)